MAGIEISKVDDILLFCDRSIQKVLREVPNEDMAVALHDESDSVKDKILSNMSERLRPVFARMMEELPPASAGSAVQKQQEFIAVMKRLYDSGELVVLEDLEKEQDKDAKEKHTTTCALTVGGVPHIRFLTKRKKRRISGLIDILCEINARVSQEGLLVLDEYTDGEFLARLDRKDVRFFRDIFNTLLNLQALLSKGETDCDALFCTSFRVLVSTYGGDKLTELCHQIIAIGAFYCRKKLHPDILRGMLMLFLSDR